MLVNQTNDGVSLDDLFIEITDVISLYNEHRTTLANLLSYTTTNAADAVPQNVQSEHFEEATEFGVPVGVSDPSYLKLGFSWKDWDLGLRMTWKYVRDATSEQIQNRVTRALEADNRLVNASILQRLLDPTVFFNDWGHSCYGLYNGDMKPPDHMGRTFAADHTHYLTTQSTTLDSLDVELGCRHIAEHGYGSTQSARFLLLAHPNDVEASKITSWRAGVEYATGKVPKFDFIPSSNAPAYLCNETVHGAAPPPDYHGLDVTGSYGKALLIESYFIPQGWCSVVATGGPGSTNNPVGFREHINPSYRGLRHIPGCGPHPLVASFLARGSAPAFDTAAQPSQCRSLRARLTPPQSSSCEADNAATTKPARLLRRHRGHRVQLGAGAGTTRHRVRPTRRRRRIGGPRAEHGRPARAVPAIRRTTRLPRRPDRISQGGLPRSRPLGSSAAVVISAAARLSPQAGYPRRPRERGCGQPRPHGDTQLAVGRVVVELPGVRIQCGIRTQSLITLSHRLSKA
ncbi:hypothetical protein [Mycolicibacterium fortuitum]|uniref:hypothetical protein n=1 Tax=Mycolicibacterium fortuitum TaxID=1766 RepID=UPI001F465E36|nr:hypothetical protein [Mycolicibacterium fortuitum]